MDFPHRSPLNMCLHVCVCARLSLKSMPLDVSILQKQCMPFAIIKIKDTHMRVHTHTRQCRLRSQVTCITCAA